MMQVIPCDCGEPDMTMEHVCVNCGMLRRTREFEMYEHHDQVVWVDKQLKGKHRDMCLCHACTQFKPGSPLNCYRANLLYAVDVALNMTTPVFECPGFEDNYDERARAVQERQRLEKSTKEE